jgi:LPS-assembly protein
MATFANLFSRPWRYWSGPQAALLFVMALAGWMTVAAAPAAAQSEFLNFRTQIRPQPPAPRSDTRGDEQMLVQAAEINYDYSNERVSAVGNVQIYYRGSTLEANKVVYDQKTKRLRAEGNVRLTEADGKITYGEVIELTDDYRDGFIDSLRLEGADQTRFAAARASRSAGNYTVFESGVYTACEPCKDDPRKPPFWQVKAARIIHNQSERMIYFEDARIEFFGWPLAYLPYFSNPDPTVKRKTGLLMPSVTSSTNYGFGVEIPYYFALAPDYDLTLAPRITTNQGALMQAEWRQRLEDGSYTVRAAGIYQLDKDFFLRGGSSPTPGYRDFRGSLETTGRFNLTPRWAWGFDGVLVTDPTFFQNYNVKSLQLRPADPFTSGLTEGVSQAFLAGRGDRSYFDVRAIYYTGFSEADRQTELPVIHPVLDYTYTLDRPILGGELGYNVNLTSLSRRAASFDAISQTAVANSLCSPATADPAVKVPANCLLRGTPGTYSRVSAEAHWRRQFIDPYGQVITPFASVKADTSAVSVSSDPGVSNYIQTGDYAVGRAMPMVGVDYRFPFIGVQSWGTQTIEPIVQVIMRPDEPSIGKLPNEDAQSLVFDDSNLFKVDKFSGWDRIEGGGRANVGLQYTAQFNRGGSVNALFGQSYQLFGINSFAVADVTNTGLGSGLETVRSDYVARLAFQPNRTYGVISRFRFDEQDFTLRRVEIEGRANFDRWSLSVLYGNYDAQPQLGFLERREGVLGQSSVKLDANWVLSGGLRYDIEHANINQSRVGIGYIDDCFILGVNYITDYSYSGNVQSNHTVTLQMSLRTLGGTGFGQ